MNKKFSTLIAGLVLAAMSGTAAAQTYANDAGGRLSEIIVAERYYQLGVTTTTANPAAKAPAVNVLAMEPSFSPGQYNLTVKPSAAVASPLRSTLWKVSISKNSEGALSYSFVNVATGLPLNANSVTAAPTASVGTSPVIPAPQTIVGGNVGLWKWEPAVTDLNNFDHIALTSAFGAALDSAVTLVQTGANVGFVKYALNNMPTEAAGATRLYLAPYDANPIYLTPDDLNSMLWSQPTTSKTSFTFDKDVANNQLANLFTSQAYKAVPAVGFPAEYGAKESNTAQTAGPMTDYNYWNSTIPAAGANAVYDALVTAQTALNAAIVAGTAVQADYDTYNTALANLKADAAFNAGVTANKWVSFIANDKTGADATYLMVDTAFLTSGAGNKNLRFNIKKFADVTKKDYSLLPGDPARLDINGRFNFQVEYFPTQDSLVIRTAGFAQKLDNQANWADMTTGVNPDLGINNVYVSHEDYLATPLTTGAYATTISAATQLRDINKVKIAVLNNIPTREVTIGASEYRAGYLPVTTVNTHIYLDVTRGGDNRTTLTDGLYFINLKTTKPSQLALNNSYKIVHLSDVYEPGQNWDPTTIYTHEENSQLFGTIQNFGYMPAAQWVVEQNQGETGKQTVNIYNREYPSIKIENVQLFKAGADGIQFGFPLNGFNTVDTVSFSTVKAVKPAVTAAYTDVRLGYYYQDPAKLRDKLYNLDYLSGIQLGNFIDVRDSQTDSLLRVDLKGGKVSFTLDTVWYTEDNAGMRIANFKPEGKFGYAGRLTQGASKLFPELSRLAYVIRIKDTNKLINNNKYIVRVEANQTSLGQNTYAISGAVNKHNKIVPMFFLKENNRVVTETEAKSTVEDPYFAMVEAYKDWTSATFPTDTLLIEDSERSGIKDGSLWMTREKMTEERIAAFAVRIANTPLYRRFDGDTSLEEKFGTTANAPVWLRFHKFNNASEVLYENSERAHNPYRNGLNDKSISFLGKKNNVEFPEATNFNYTFYVDTAYVRDQTIMPQYLMGLRPEFVKGDTIWCQDPNHTTRKDSLDCYHTKITQNFTRAMWLYNAHDSVTRGNEDYVGKKEYGAVDLVRLAFLDGVHHKDTFYVLRGANAGIKTEDINLYAMKFAAEDKIYLGTNVHNNVKWQYRLIDDQAGMRRRFLMESFSGEVANRQTSQRGAQDVIVNKANGVATDKWNGIAPEVGGWVRMQNDVPVLSYKAFSEAVDGQAEIFDVKDGVEKGAVSTEDVATTTVQVIAANGSVIVKGAAGKQVVISNILGQTIANTVITSDNQTISTPQGVVIVSVAGEKAVKAMVK